MKISYSEQAVGDLKVFNRVEQVLIAKKIEYLAENFEALKKSKKVRELKGTQFSGQFRYTIARKIRAIFRIESGKIVLLILRVGKRSRVYE